MVSRRRYWIAMFVLGVVVGLVSNAVGATGIDKEWSSTAAFDGGTKSDPGDGNYGIESVTDNGGIAAGTMEIASVKGDSFTYADADADTWRWDVFAATSPTVNTRAIASGVLTIDITQTVTGSPVAGVVLRTTLSGELDIRVKVIYRSDAIATGANSWWTGITIQNEKPTATQGVCALFGGATVDGVAYYYKETGNAGLKNVNAYTCTNGVMTAVGALTTLTNDPRWLRVTRNGASTTDYKFWYSTDGTTWTLDESSTFATVGSSVYVTLFIYLEGATADRVAMDFDDYAATVRTVAVGGFRSSGNWTSDAYTVDGTMTISQVVLSTESLTATEVVDFVRLYQNGTLTEEWTDDIESGTLHVLNVTATTHYAVTVRVGLKGVQSATPVLTAMGLILDAVPSGAVVSDMTDMYLLIVGFVLYGILSLFGIRVPLLWIFAGVVLVMLAVTIYDLTAAAWLASIAGAFGALQILAGGVYTLKPPQDAVAGFG